MPTQRTRAYLDALWINFYTPDQSNYEDLFQSYFNILDDTAIETDARAGTDNTKVITPVSARQAIQEGLGFKFWLTSQAGNQYNAVLDYFAPINAITDDTVFQVLISANSVGADTIVFNTTSGPTTLPLVKGTFAASVPIAANDLVAFTCYDILLDTGNNRAFVGQAYGKLAGTPVPTPPVVVNIAFADSPYSITGLEDFILVDSTLGAVQIIALAANSALAKAKFPVIKDAFGTCLINDIYITPNGADTIDTVNANYSMAANKGIFGASQLTSNGTNGYSIT